MRKFDWVTLLLLLMLLTCGIIAIYSASTAKIGNDFQTENYYIKQIIWIIIAFIITFLIVRTPYSTIEILITPAYIISIILLIIVLFMPEIKGSQRWIPLGLFNFQPSEIAKLTTILLVTKLISKPHINNWQIISRSFLFFLIPITLIFFEPDLGTSLSFIVSLFVILAISDLSAFYIILIVSPLISIVVSFSLIVFIIYILILIFILYKTELDKIIIGFAVALNTFFFFITPFIWNSLKVYQQNRILTFIDPMRDPFGAGYQIIQSRIAIGSGGFWGKGFLMGTQKNLNFLPEHHTDFIFSVIGEEFGFLGCAIILLIYFLFLYRIVRNINVLKRKEFRFAAIGILAYLTFQIFINIGMNIGIVPTTGIPLPFISYGGSNLLINVLAIGLVLKFLNERSIFE